MEEEKKSNRGGRRAGAGRPATGRKAVKTVTVQLMPEEAAILERVEHRGEFIRAAIRAYALQTGV